MSSFQTICLRRPWPTARRLGGEQHWSDSVSQSTAYTAKTFLCALLPQMGRVVFWVRGSVAQDRTPPEELNGLYETEKSVVWLSLCIGSFQSDGCRVLSTSLVRANSLGCFCMAVWMQGTCVVSEALLFFQIFS